ncbi:uncharacterized protein LOC108913134 [Anoplophora glabripennis]|uniref:uncharacterized protein LOC108913134 n=1 Tax=Anoplophora glabripennis TaxID=217634 RepID=UPI0008739710|nr:uncharacterized protein LOC108913134 [Anoplophora glabripennis]
MGRSLWQYSFNNLNTRSYISIICIVCVTFTSELRINPQICIFKKEISGKVVPMLHLPFPAPPTIDSLEVDIPTSTVTHEVIDHAFLEEQDVPLHVYSKQTKIAHDQPSTSTAEVIEKHASTSFSEYREMICTTPVMDLVTLQIKFKP